MSRQRRTLLALVLLFVLLRAALLLSIADVFGYGEEFAKGTAGKVMLDGLGIPHYQLTYGYHEGGGFVMSHLDALAFLVLGPCVMAIKLVALSFSVATLLVGFWMLSEHVSTRAGHVFALLYAFAPDAFLRNSLLCLGTHTQACLFILLGFHFTLRVLKGAAASRHAPLALGLVAGFGTYFSPQMLPVLAVAGVAILVRVRGKELASVVLRSLAGFAIGALPLWWMISHVGIEGVMLHRASHADRARTSFLQALPEIVAPILQSTDPITWLQAGTFTVAMVWGWMRRRTGAHALLVGYLCVYLIGWCASGLVIPYKREVLGAWINLNRLEPPWLVVTLLAALGIDSLWSSGGVKRMLALGTCAIAVLGSTRAILELVRAGRPSAPLENASILLGARGYWYNEYYDRLETHFGANEAEKAPVMLRAQDDPALLVPDVAQALYDRPNRPIESILPEIGPIFGPHRDLALLGLGRLVHGTNWNYDVPAAFARLETFPEDMRAPLAEALGRAGLGPYFRADRLGRLLAVQPPEPWHERWWRGVGWRIHKTFRLRPDLAREQLAALPERDRGPATRGYEQALALDRIR